MDLFDYLLENDGGLITSCVRYGPGKFFAYIDLHMDNLDTVDNLQGGDNDWASIYFLMEQLNWYPYAEGNSVLGAINALKDKLNKLGVKESERTQLYVAIASIQRIGLEKVTYSNRSGDPVLSDFRTVTQEVIKNLIS